MRAQILAAPAAPQRRAPPLPHAPTEDQSELAGAVALLRLLDAATWRAAAPGAAAAVEAKAPGAAAEAAAAPKKRKWWEVVLRLNKKAAGENQAPRPAEALR